MNRYKELFDIVLALKPKHCVEIGTWSGKRAMEWMAAVDCYYTGFDLFEDASKETDEREFNVKPHYEMVEVAKSIETTGSNKFCLIRGDTNTTLWETELEPFDFCFIDGGHSVDTIKNDFDWATKNIEKGGVIVLDDYYTPEKRGVGCNFIHSPSKGRGTLLKSKDPVAGGGSVQLLRVDA